MRMENSENFIRLLKEETTAVKEHYRNSFEFFIRSINRIF